MRMRERQDHDRETPPATALPRPDADTRRTAERLFAAADDAIARALSHDSAAFLHAARQTGGQ